MTISMGTLVFSRYDSARLPGKALRQIGGMPLLERVIRRAQLLPWQVYLATTVKPSDDALCDLAQRLGVPVFRGPEDRVLERAVLAADAFGLEMFVRLCGDRPLFPLDSLLQAAATVTTAQSVSAAMVDLVTDYVPGRTVRGLTTEVVRSATLRRIHDRGVTADQQEHLTQYFYDNPSEFVIARLPLRQTVYACPGFAVDTEADLRALDFVFADHQSVEMSVAEADDRYRHAVAELKGSGP